MQGWVVVSVIVIGTGIVISIVIVLVSTIVIGIGVKVVIVGIINIDIGDRFRFSGAEHFPRLICYVFVLVRNGELLSFLVSVSFEGEAESVRPEYLIRSS